MSASYHSPPRSPRRSASPRLSAGSRRGSSKSSGSAASRGSKNSGSKKTKFSPAELARMEANKRRCGEKQGRFDCEGDSDCYFDVEKGSHIDEYGARVNKTIERCMPVPLKESAKSCRRYAREDCEEMEKCDYIEDRGCRTKPSCSKYKYERSACDARDDCEFGENDDGAYCRSINRGGRKPSAAYKSCSSIKDMNRCVSVKGDAKLGDCYWDANRKNRKGDLAPGCLQVSGTAPSCGKLGKNDCEDSQLGCHWTDNKCRKKHLNAKPRKKKAAPSANEHISRYAAEHGITHAEAVAAFINTMESF